MKKVLVFLGLFIITISCTKDILNPDIEAIRISPLGFYLIDPVGVIPIDSVVLTATNSQDAHITGYFWEFYDYTGELFYTAPEPFPMDVEISGLVDPSTADTTIIMGLLVPVEPLCSHIWAESLMSARVVLRFLSEADFFPDRTDTTDISFGVYRLQSFYIVNLESSEDSLPRDSAGVFAKITATAQDFAGNPVVGAELQFSVDRDSIAALTSPLAITGNDGTASVWLYCILPGLTTVWIWVTVDHPYANHPLSIPIKFYP